MSAGKYIYTLLMLLTLCISGLSQGEINFKVEAPGQVSTGSPFNVSFVINSRASNFDWDTPAGVDILGGPSNRSGANTYIINGQMRQEYETRVSYSLIVNKTGSITLPPATIKANGETYKTDPVTITVKKGGDNPFQIDNDELFLRLYISDRDVYQGEHIVASLKIYTTRQLSYEDLDMPVFNGFWKEDIDLGDQSAKKEQYNGKTYLTQVLKKWVLIPQKSGKLAIEPASATCAVRVEYRSPGSFFRQYREVNKTIKSSPATINVKPFPEPAPKGFTGAVGKLNFEASLNREEVKANESITLTMKISGSGNLKLISPPEPALPTDFEIYDPKVKNNLRVSTAGIKGSREFEYLVIPRHAGNFEIPEIAFSYLDPGTGKYRTEKAGPFEIKVNKADGQPADIYESEASKEEVSILSKDIRYIKTGYQGPPLRKYWVDNLLFYSGYLIVLFGTVAGIFTVRNRARKGAGKGVVQKKAGKKVQKKLKGAREALDKGHSEFYSSLVNAYSDYLSEKLEIPRSELNKESIQRVLNNKNVSADLIEETNTFMEDIEFARYAPAVQADGSAREKDLQKASSIIGELERRVK